MVKHIRIFVSSPGDVQDERQIIFDTIKNLQDQLLREGIVLEIVAWDAPSSRTVMRANMTPQEAINLGMRQPEECDIVLVLLWSRMGTPLPSEHKKADGSPFLSGTEWEYYNAVSKDAKNKPIVVLYRRTEEVLLNPDMPDFDERARQKKLVNTFFKQFKSEDGSLAGGFNEYRNIGHFREIINIDLQRLISELRNRQPLEPVSPAAAPVALPKVRVVGKAPISPSDIFKNRSEEITDIVESLLNSRYRAVSIHSNIRGTGKTALACRVMDKIEADADGLIYLSSRNIDLEHIFLNSARILGGETEKFLTQFWSEPQTNIKTKIQKLLEYYEDNKIVILLDNIEPERMQADDGSLKDADLNSFIDEFLKSNHSARLLLTSCYPLKVSPDAQLNVRLVSLDYGLPKDEAASFIRELDPKNELNLRDEPALIERIIARTHGIPRAIQSIVGILTQDPLLDVSEILDNDELFNREIAEQLLAEAEKRLDEQSRSVVYAVAIFQHAYENAVITKESISAILDSHWRGELAFINEVLRKLAMGRFIKIYNRREISLTPLDASYYYHLVESKDDQYDPIEMNRLAAAYYEQLGNSLVINKFEDLDIPLAEFEHHVLAKDFDKAALVLNKIDPYLILWGHAQRVFRMRQRIASMIKDPVLSSENYGLLGRACRRLALRDEAEKHLKHALETAEKMHDVMRQGLWLNELSINSRYLSDYSVAIEYGERALKFHKEANNKTGEEIALGNMGIAYRNMADYAKAIELLNEAIAINPNSSSHGDWISNIGIAVMHQGQFKEAIDYQNKAIEMASRLGDKFVECISLENKGYAYYHLGDYQNAIQYNEESLKISIQTGDRRREANNRAGLAQAYHEMGKLDEAIPYAEEAIRISIQKETRDPRREGGTRGILGRIYTDKGIYDKALEEFGKGLNIAQTKKDIRRVGRHMSDQGIISREKGDYKGALNLQLEGLKVLTGKDAGNEIGHSKSEVGRSYSLMQDFAEAQRYLEESLELAVEFGQLQQVQMRAIHLAQVHFLNGSDALALDYVQRALERIEENSKNRAHILTVASLILFATSGTWDERTKEALEQIPIYLESLENMAPDYQRIQYIRMLYTALLALYHEGKAEQEKYLEAALKLSRSLRSAGLRYEYLRLLEKLQTISGISLFNALLSE